jgi:poly(3-hydroxybutyrate) depolymerase
MLEFFSSIIFTIAILSIAEVFGWETTGCGKAYDFHGLPMSHTIKSSSMRRKFGVRIPRSYNQTRQYPVIVGYHGNGRTGLYFEVDTRLDDEDFAEDTILVYPDGVDGSWAGASYANTTMEQDLQFTHDMLATVRQEYCVDSARIYATGKSNGGGFVGSLACNDTVGGQFAAFAAVAGAFYPDNEGLLNGCKPVRGLAPMMEFHGVADETIAYAGGKAVGGTSPSISAW